MCECPECGPVDIAPSDLAMLALDEDWMRQRLRMAMTLGSRSGVEQVGHDVWRLGYAGRVSVLLARSLYRLWREPTLVEQARLGSGALQVITPKSDHPRGAPFTSGVQWLPLEDSFAWYGGGVTFLGLDGAQDTEGASDPTKPVYGPFSADFRWVSLPGEDGPAVACTQGQAVVFRALWEFRGEPRTADQVMRRAALASQKPVDVFKGTKYTEAARAYRALVMTQQRQGLYAMPLAATASTDCVS